MKVLRSNGRPPRGALRRRRLAVAAAGVALLTAAVAGAAPVAASAASPGAAATATRTAPQLQIFYRSPVLVRAGEAVRIPVDAVCVADGVPCEAGVRLSIAGSRARSVAAAADPTLVFDLSGPAARLRSGGRIDYRLSATAGSSASVAYPGGAGGSLHVYVAPRMASVALPAIPYGSYRSGRTVLFLPWGSGESDAGLSAAEEGATLGPSSFAIAPDGTIEVADAFHQRIVEFRGGRLITNLALAMSPQTDVAVGADSETYVASDYAIGERRTRFTVLDAGGDLSSFRTVPGGILSQIGTDGTTAYARMLPLAEWVPFPSGGSSASVADTGLPLPSGGMMLRSIVGNSVRLGVATGSAVTGAVELQSGSQLGDLAFASPDGAGGYVAVVRVVGSDGDQYEVAHVGADRSIDAFAVPSHQYAQPLPQAQFRLGPDGALYQMITSPDGMRIVRYAIGGNR